MMSINEVKTGPSTLSQVILKQYGYKLKGHSGLIYSLIIVQLLAILLSLGSSSGMSSNSDLISIAVRTYTGDILLICSLLWLMVVASLLGSQPYRSMEFSVVNNRLVSHASNILLLLTYAAYAGVTSTLAVIIHRLMLSATLKEGEFLLGGLQIIPQDLLLGIFVATLYFILVAATVYLIQSFSLHSKGLGIILWICFFAFGFGTVRIFDFNLGKVLEFYAAETSLGVFVLKVFCTAVLFFGSSMLITKGMEAKR
ncbi:hypothetical protein HMPREF0322_01434 [Desulfitobacterium hafniense DP7]|uniref:Uncharacterized protein n=2 Tax=Desulfitobacterium hafniense TaxID=49338 RepID=G9XKF1_DESHA|nr:hypothetical protein [Desulfitobacterium hafniense]EHL08037.1 hypothetical protein HMPREF0322_01434 [Desulfitobacterium hafniense DP7]